MKILFVNKYFYLKGGSENNVFETSRLLEDNGHEAIFFSMKDPQNLKSEYEKYFVTAVNYNGTIREKLGASLKILYSIEAKKKIQQLIEDKKPDIVHLNNIYHQLSPSIIHVLKKHNIPTVMTLHDYKMVCASYSLFNGRNICEACKNGRYYQSFLKGCVKDSRAKSLLNVMEMYLHHNILDIYDFVDVFISPYSTFYENKLRDMGFRKRLVHLQNFLRIEDYNPNYEYQEKSVTYFGRLSEEKGVLTLIKAFRNIRNAFLKIIGDGPMREELERFIGREKMENVRLLGYKKGSELKDEIAKSMFVVVPSEHYEPFGLTIIEAFALGKPVIGSNIAGIPERVINEQTGLLFEPGNAAELTMRIESLIDNEKRTTEMGKRARAFVEREFNAEKYYQELLRIYQYALSMHARSS